MQVDFWQLSRDPAELVVAQIAARTLAAGERLLVVSGDEALSARIDRALWEHRPDAFLAHGRADAPHAARQPILIGPGCTAANGAGFVVLADGLWRDEALTFARAFLLFGDDHLAAARACWRALGEQAGLERSFWRQEDGRWVKAG